jgi:hypothetical protein
LLRIYPSFYAIAVFWETTKGTFAPKWGKQNIKDYVYPHPIHYKWLPIYYLNRWLHENQILMSKLVLVHRLFVTQIACIPKAAFPIASNVHLNNNWVTFTVSSMLSMTLNKS